MTNEERSQAEVAAFRARKYTKYFAYWKDTNSGAIITTWMGDKLADVTWRGSVYNSAWFSRRVNFRAKGIDGRMWHGIYYLSSGNYVRMSVSKHQRAR